MIECLGRVLPRIDLVEYRRRAPQTVIRSHCHAGLFQLDHYVCGEGTFTIEGSRHEIDRDVFFLVAPGQRHEIRGTPGDVMEKLTAKFSHPELPRGCLPPVFRPSHKQTLIATELFRQVVAEGVLGTSERRVTAALRLSELLLLLLSMWRDETVPEGGSSALAIAKRFMTDRFQEPLSLDGVSRAAGVSPEHLCRLFRENANATPMGFLRQLRVSRARALLETHQGCLREIATAAGFSSTKDMNRAFRRLLGTSPRAFRREILGR